MALLTQRISFYGARTKIPPSRFPTTQRPEPTSRITPSGDRTSASRLAAEAVRREHRRHKLPFPSQRPRCCSCFQWLACVLAEAGLQESPNNSSTPETDQ